MGFLYFRMHSECNIYNSTDLDQIFLKIRNESLLPLARITCAWINSLAFEEFHLFGYLLFIGLLGETVPSITTVLWLWLWFALVELPWLSEAKPRLFHQCKPKPKPKPNVPLYEMWALPTYKFLLPRFKRTRLKIVSLLISRILGMNWNLAVCITYQMFTYKNTANFQLNV